MRIGIDYHVSSGIFQGTRTYLYNLMKEIAELDSENEYLLFNADWEDSRMFSGYKNITQRKVFSNSGRFNLVAGFPYRAWRDKIDLFHTQYISPMVLPCRTIVTIHDVLFERYPDFFPVNHRRLLRLLIPLAAWKAAKIIAVSEFTKRELVEFYDIPPSKIVVTLEGTNERFRRIDDGDLVDEKLKEIKMSRPYILYVGRIAPIKNIVALLEAFHHVKNRCVSDLKLAIVGQKDPLFREEMAFGRLRELKMERDAAFIGGVTEETLVYLYNGAEAFVLPSFGEGFGLPALEAMACGTPVIVSRVTSLPEVVGDAGLFFDPLEKGELTEKLETVLTDSTLRSELSKRGMAQAKKFSWRKTAKKTVRVYEQALRRAR